MESKKQAELHNIPTAPPPVMESMQMSTAPGYPPYYASERPPPSYNEALSHPVAVQGAAFYNPQAPQPGPGVYASSMPYGYAPPAYVAQAPHATQPMHIAQPPHVSFNAKGKQMQTTAYPMQAVAVAPGDFDAGARFGSGSQVRIPPPPPGIAPNAAQLASMSGHNVVVGQKQGSWLSGGSSGGYTFW